MGDANPEVAIRGSKGMLTAAIMIASFMAFVDIAIVNVALADIRASFGTPIDRISWISTSYMMANIVAIPMSGWMQRRFGFRRYFVACVVVFTLASALCAESWSFNSLVAFRTLQGLGGGAIIPTAQALLFLRYPREQHGAAASLIGVASISGPLLGPFIGGWLIDFGEWHWIFAVNVPLGALACVLAWRSIDERSTRGAPVPIDLPGIGLLAFGLVALVYALEEGYRSGWLDDLSIRTAVTVAAVCLCTFLVHELETRHPLLELRLFRSPSYAAATAINFLVGACVFSGGFMLALFCGSVMNYPPLATGRIFLLGNAPLLVLMPLSARLTRYVDGRLSIAAGSLVIALSMWLNAHFTGRMDPFSLVWPVLVRDVGIASVFVPLVAYALSDTSPAHRGQAAALFNLTRELGGSVGTAWMTTSLDRSARIHAAGLSAAFHELRSIATTEFAGIDAFLRARGVAPSVGALKWMKLRIARESLVLAFDDCFAVLAASFVAAIAVVPFLSRSATGDLVERGH